MKQEKCSFIPSLLLDFSNHSQLKAPMYILTSTVHTLCIPSIDWRAGKDKGVRLLYLTQQIAYAVSILYREIQGIVTTIPPLLPIAQPI